MSQAAQRPWSLQYRLTFWFAVTAVVLGGAVSATCAWLLSRSLERELTGLVLEEFDEMEALLGASDGSPEAFLSIADEIALHHPENAVSWVVWERATGAIWAQRLRSPLPEEARPAPMPPGRVLVLEDGNRWRAQAQGEGLVMGMLLGAESRLALARRFELFLFVFVGVAVVLATLAGALFGRRVARQLHRVADEARSVRSPGEDLGEVLGAPEEIREVSDALQEMLANIRLESEKARIVAAELAHELRSPIQNLLGETEVALLRERDPAYYRTVLASNQEELRELGRAVDNLVTLAGSDQERAPRELERFDLGREADLRLSRERQQADRCGVRIELATDGDLLVRGDREALLLALRNLVSNAIDWSPEGGVVRVSLSASRDLLELVVEDMGPGVPEDEREAIFEPFRRGRAADGHRVGYGLGLALVRRAVQTHGGSIAVTRGTRGGARFQIELPRGLDGPPSRTILEPAFGKHLQRPKRGV